MNKNNTKILLEDLQPSHFEQEFLFIDTNILVLAHNNSTFFKQVLIPLKQNPNCVLLTIPSVVFEFTRGSDSIIQYNNKHKLVNQIFENIWPVEKFLSEINEFTLVLHKTSPKMQYTDFLLCVALHKFPGRAVVMTQNHHDFAGQIGRAHV